MASDYTPNLVSPLAWLVPTTPQSEGMRFFDGVPVIWDVMPHSLSWVMECSERFASKPVFLMRHCKTGR